VLLIAVFVFGEPFGGVRAVAFGLIWAALAIYTWSMLRKRKAV
ncbi:EamA family transporter RarD, partial [Rhizobiaceae sp. 2RAB30]